jgi:hypothetical protein
VLPPLAETEMGLEHEKDLTETQLQHQSTESDKARKHRARKRTRAASMPRSWPRTKDKQKRKPLS